MGSGFLIKVMLQASNAMQHYDFKITILLYNLTLPVIILVMPKLFDIKLTASLCNLPNKKGET